MTNGRVQIETDLMKFAWTTGEPWPHSFVPEVLQSADYANLNRKYLAEFGDHSFPNAQEFHKRHPEIRPLLADIMENGRPLRGKFDTVVQQLILGNNVTLSFYLDSIVDFLRQYVVFSNPAQPDAVALWIAHSYLIDCFECSPILHVTSAEMRSGKTRVLDCLELLVPNPEPVILPSEAVLYSMLAGRRRITLLLDEVDTIFRMRSERYEGIRAVLNAGNRKGSRVPRVNINGRNRTIEYFGTYGPKVLAGIGDIPSTIADRSIRIDLKRKRSDEQVKKFRERRAREEATTIRFPSDVRIPAGEISIPDELNDRAADSWEPLFAIADLAGGDWPKRARRAAVILSESDLLLRQTHGIRLLSDIKSALVDKPYITTKELLDALHEMEDAPWCEWYGKPLSARGLAKLLEPYGIHPKLSRNGFERSRGYLAADFADSWARYVPSSPEPSVTTATSVPEALADSLGDGRGTDVTGSQLREEEGEKSEDVGLCLPF